MVFDVLRKIPPFTFTKHFEVGILFIPPSSLEVRRPGGMGGNAPETSLPVTQPFLRAARHAAVLRCMRQSSHEAGRPRQACACLSSTLFCFPTFYFAPYQKILWF